MSTFGRMRRPLLTGVLLASAGLMAVAFSVSRAAETVTDWPSYNRTLTSERYVPLDQINKANVAQLTQVCVYDLDVDTSFQTGPIVIGRTLYGTTDTDTFAIDAGTCQQKWRVHENIKGGLPVNRGVAYLDGRLFRGTQDGRVFAYDAATGKKAWEQTIADPKKGESVPAAPIAWNGLVFIGNAGGDRYEGRGRMYALDANTGKMAWETYMVPNDGPPAPNNERMQALARQSWGNARDVPVSGGATWTSYTLDPAKGLLYIPGGNPSPDFLKEMRPGANLFSDSVVILDAKTGVYVNHYSLVPEDFHDWDVANTPTVVTTKSGKHVLAEAPKDGQLYAYNLDTNQRMFVTAITTRENVAAPLSEKPVHFCPGSSGGSEWNGTAYSPDTNLFYNGTEDWCTTVVVKDPTKPFSVSLGQQWTGSGDGNLFGKKDPNWSGWVMATDADTGQVKWRFKTTAPALSGVTPTKGGLVFVGDLGNHAFALDADSGKVLWQTELNGAAGGGVVSYLVEGKQRVAFVAGTRSPIFPVATASAKIVVFGLP
ncbi:MAG TPA: PQQ-binding-like beta-propeller repeat protein [Micropepsaceae bacterium]|nr:PQQ-binding-like beta-propeller repeat protein [Micropepsaceae bacterium]